MCACSPTGLVEDIRDGRVKCTPTYCGPGKNPLGIISNRQHSEKGNGKVGGPEIHGFWPLRALAALLSAG